MVLFGDYISAFGAIRGLSKYGVPIYMVSSRGEGLALKSRFVKKVLVLAPDDPRFISKLDTWLSRRVGDKAVLIVAGEDGYLDALSKHHHELSGDIRVTFPDWETVKLLRQKRLTYQTAERVGVPVPKTRHISDEVQLEEFLSREADSFGFPLFLKMEDSGYLLERYGTKGVICNDATHVRNSYQRYDGFCGDLLIQEMLPGDAETIKTVLMALNHRSEPMGFTINEKKRSSGRFLSGTLVVSSWSEELLTQSMRLAKEIGYYGYAGFQYKLDTKDGRFKLLEANGRVSMSNSLSLKCGVNLPYLMYDEAVNKNRPEVRDYRRRYKSNVIWWYAIEDIVSFLRFNRKIMSLGRYLKSLLGSAYTLEPFSLRDPYPGLISLFNPFVLLLRRLLRKKKT